MKSVSDVFWGSNFNQNLMDFDPKCESHEDDTLPEVLKCAKSIFEQQFQCFQGFASSRKYVNPWFWKQKSTLKPSLREI